MIVVIHVSLDIDQVLRNLKIAEDNGADGVFLINHQPVRPDQLLGIYLVVKPYHPKLWIGLNLLGLEPDTARERLPNHTVSLWADNAGIDEDGVSAEAERFQRNRRLSKWQGIYFGGVAFKGQNPVTMANLERVAKAAVPFVDVITTSGQGTGFAPDVEKIRVIREAIGHTRPLAIASGTTPKNVYMFMPYVDVFMVATGVSDSFYMLNPKKVWEFKKAIS